MKYTPLCITPDGSQLIVSSDVGLIAVDLKVFDTADKVKAEILRAIAIASPIATDKSVSDLVGKSVTVSDADIVAEKQRQQDEADAKALEAEQPE